MRPAGIIKHNILFDAFSKALFWGVLSAVRLFFFEGGKERLGNRVVMRAAQCWKWLPYTAFFHYIRFSNDNISGNDMDFRREIDITCQLYFASGPSMMEIQLIWQTIKEADMDFFEHLRGIDFCTFLDFPTTCTVRNRPRVKIFEDGRVSLYGELRKHAAEQ